MGQIDVDRSSLEDTDRDQVYSLLHAAGAEKTDTNVVFASRDGRPVQLAEGEKILGPRTIVTKTEGTALKVSL